MLAEMKVAKLALLALITILPGCLLAVVAVAGAATFGAISYSNNGAEQDFKASLESTWQATISAVRDAGYPVDPASKPDANEGTIDSGDLHVRVERHPGNFTRVIVRIGTFKTDDHKRQAKLILEQVAGQLAES